MATVNLGRVSFVMKGDYSSSTTYKRLDVVSFGGVSYAAKQDVPTGTVPTNTTYWQVLTDWREAVWSPTPAATVSAMTDQSAVYLYTGSESGYTKGDWYYYNGSAWTSGGAYNSVA